MGMSYRTKPAGSGTAPTQPPLPYDLASYIAYYGHPPPDTSVYGSDTNALTPDEYDFWKAFSYRLSDMGFTCKQWILASDDSQRRIMRQVETQDAVMPWENSKDYPLDQVSSDDLATATRLCQLVTEGNPPENTPAGLDEVVGPSGDLDASIAARIEHHGAASGARLPAVMRRAGQAMEATVVGRPVWEGILSFLAAGAIGFAYGTFAVKTRKARR